MQNIYAILDKKNNTIYKDWITINADFREIEAAARKWTNDERSGGILCTNYEDFAIVKIGTIEEDHIELLQDKKGNSLPYEIMIQLSSLKNSGI